LKGQSPVPRSDRFPGPFSKDNIDEELTSRPFAANRGKNAAAPLRSG